MLEYPAWARVLPLLVVAVLVALLVVPYLLYQRAERVRAEIDDAADPGRTEVTQIQYQLARQTSALRGYVVSRDTTLLVQFNQNVREEREALRRLEPKARSLGPTVYAHFVQLRDASDRWHASIADEVNGTRELTVTPGQLPFERELYLEALAAGTRLDGAILEAARERRAVIDDLQRLSLRINVLLVGLALAAALSVGWLSRRAQRLAIQSEARRREAEAALRETARAEKSRAALIRGVSHDVKNPLGAADGYAALLELGVRGSLAPQQMETVAKLRGALRSALRIIEDLLDLSRAEGGVLPLSWATVDLRPVVEEMVDQYRGMLESARHGFDLRVEVGECPVRTDVERVRQVLGNLLSNAVKYTPAEGRITVSLARRDEGPRAGGWVAVAVRDTGPGIAPEWREQIFEEFARAPGAAASGHGLGLAISRRIARLLGGELTVESEPGSGSTFTLWLPAGVATQQLPHGG